MATTTGESEEVKTMHEEGDNNNNNKDDTSKLVEEDAPKLENKKKRPKAPRQKKTREAPSHPPYFQMIREAILALQEKSGSSSYAIAKYIEEKHKAVLPANFKKMLTLQLKNCTAKGKLIKVKASFKLSEMGKKENKAVKSVNVKRPKRKSGGGSVASKATVESMKNARVSDRVTRSANVAKAAKMVSGRRTKKSGVAKPKQPISIKSPAAKKAKKSVA